MNKSILAVVLVIVLAISVSLNVLLYLQNQTISKPNSDLALYNKEFGNVQVLSHSYDFSPPVTMYGAIKVGLESDGWNTTSLENMTVRVFFDYCEFHTNATSNGFQVLHAVMPPVDNYSPFQANNITYRYIWQIVVDKTEYLGIMHTPPYGLYLVDAQTGELIPHGPLY
jgi:hypothetical protein